MKLIITDIESENQINLLEKRFKSFTHVVYTKY